MAPRIPPAPGLALPPGLGSAQVPDPGSQIPDPGSRAPFAPPGLSAPPGLAAASRRPKLCGGVARLLEWRSDVYGLASPDPALSPAVLSLLDGMLSPRPDHRLSVADAARRLDELCGGT